MVRLLFLKRPLPFAYYQARIHSYCFQVYIPVMTVAAPGHASMVSNRDVLQGHGVARHGISLSWLHSRPCQPGGAARHAPPGPV